MGIFKAILKGVAKFIGGILEWIAGVIGGLMDKMLWGVLIVLALAALAFGAGSYAEHQYHDTFRNAPAENNTTLIDDIYGNAENYDGRNVTIRAFASSNYSNSLAAPDSNNSLKLDCSGIRIVKGNEYAATGTLSRNTSMMPETTLRCTKNPVFTGKTKPDVGFFRYVYLPWSSWI